MNCVFQHSKAAISVLQFMSFQTIKVAPEPVSNLDCFCSAPSGLGLINSKSVNRQSVNSKLKCPFLAGGSSEPIQPFSSSSGG